MHLKDLLGSIARVGYRIPVPDFYLVLYGLAAEKHYNGLINQSTSMKNVCHYAVSLTQVLVIMTHTYNFSNDQVALTMITETYKFVRQWTHLDLVTQQPLAAADEYFAAYPEERPVVWQVKTAQFAKHILIDVMIKLKVYSVISAYLTLYHTLCGFVWFYIIIYGMDLMPNLILITTYNAIL